MLATSKEWLVIWSVLVVNLTKLMEASCQQVFKMFQIRIGSIHTKGFFDLQNLFIDAMWCPGCKSSYSQVEHYKSEVMRFKSL